VNHEQTEKTVIVTAPAALIDDASAATTAIDTKDFDYCTIDVILGATDIGITVLKVQESDDDAVADAYADVTGLVFGTSTDIDGSLSVVPSATDDNKVFTFEVDLRGRERYLDVVCTVDDGTVGGYVAIIARLSRAKEMPITSAERGRDQILRV